MKIGFPNHPRHDLLKELRWIADHRFEFVDLFLEADKCEPHQLDLPAAKRLLDDAGLDRVGHTPWYLPIGSPAPALRRAAVEIAKPYLAALAELGCRTATIHSHWPPGMFSLDEGIAFQTETLQALVPVAKDHGLRLVYEPVDKPQDNRVALAKLLALNPEVGLHADLGHWNLHGRQPAEYIKEFGPRIEHVHLHDNDGDSDIHLPPGTGTVDWSKVVKALKPVYDGTITLEVFARDKDFVLLARDKLRRLWDRV